MSTGEFSGVDHDLLADYLGGALAGTPEETEVARLVTEDPAWAQAHASLAPAVAEVRADLSALGERSPEMPAEIADRILAAMGAAAPSEATQDDIAAVDRATDAIDGLADDSEPTPTGARPALVPAQPLGGSRRPARTLRPAQDRDQSRPGQRRRRWSRLAGPVALAAVAVLGIGVLQVARHQAESQTASGTALSDQGTSNAEPYGHKPQDAQEHASANTAKEPAPAAAEPRYRVAAPPERTGTDYSSEQLAKAEPLPTVRKFAGSPEPQLSAAGGRPAGLGDLARLGDQMALSACLAEIGSEHGGPVTFDAVDYARFQGRPALVVRFTDDSGTRWSWVSGPDCGIPGSGSDNRYRTRVG
ncbi:hypothetical protein Vqi01_39680 [Micromonospora qiuiae]|uniref:Zinc-finger domain-containing protein n=1 Tax=Micromonospora qiuiae TaxID=502268 RepID=A0ABQ4JFB5_9ACTN|nr:hypothetical protein [Micromonospora qiuiae]GIJ28806.1 hypothetical protein Vqi01_39680 [Micromonospora qiuiae]